MKNCVLAIDAGGTFFKYQLLTPCCDVIPGTGGKTDAHSDGSAAEIERAYLAMTQNALEQAQRLGRRIDRVCVSTPGPYNYAGGFSMMNHKFAAIKGVSVIPWFHRVLPGVSVFFLSDANAFLLGEAFCGAGQDRNAPAGVTLGTGFGFACMRNQRLLVRESLIPAGALWDKPYREGIVEDYVSRRAIRARYQAISDKHENPDVREIADRARSGDPAAVQTFQMTGKYLGEILREPVERFAIDMVVLGGQIARAHDLFLPEAQPFLPCPIVFAAHPDDAALRGAAFYGLHGSDGTMSICPDEF